MLEIEVKKSKSWLKKHWIAINKLIYTAFRTQNDHF